MAERYYRAQLLLDTDQHQALREIAKREARSISDVAREIIARGLADRQADQAKQAARRAQALESLGEIREAIRRRHGVYSGDLVAETRAEREEDRVQILRSKSQ